RVAVPDPGRDVLGPTESDEQVAELGAIASAVLKRPERAVIVRVVAGVANLGMDEGHDIANRVDLVGPEDRLRSLLDLLGIHLDELLGLEPCLELVPVLELAPASPPRNLQIVAIQLGFHVQGDDLETSRLIQDEANVLNALFLPFAFRLRGVLDAHDL